MKVSKSESIGNTINVSLETVEESAPSALSREMFTELEEFLGFSSGRLRPVTPNQRAHQSEFGLVVYGDFPSWGVKFPLSPFVLQFLNYLEITPAQLSGMAWCYLNSFEYIFEQYKDKFAECPLNVPTVPVFLHYFNFQQDKSWVTARKRRHLFHNINKVDRHPDKFAFLPRNPDHEHLDAGWREFVEEEWKVQIYVPGRRELNCWEKICIDTIESIKKGIIFCKLALFVFNM